MIGLHYRSAESAARSTRLGTGPADSLPRLSRRGRSHRLRRLIQACALAGVFAVAALLPAEPAAARSDDWETLPWQERLGRSWFEHRAEQGDPAAQYRLALLLERGIDGPVDRQGAELWHRRAAEQGHAPSQERLAYLLLSRGPDQATLAEAAGWLEKAAEAGSATAQYNLAALRERGLGGEQDRAAARRLYRQAYHGGLDSAALALGLLLAEGEGPEAEPVTALAWLSLAADSGVEGAAIARDQLSARLDETARRDAGALVAELRRTP